MTDSGVTRRAVLAVLAGMAAAMPAAGASGQQASATRFGRIVVDTSRVADLGAPQTAAVLRQELQAELSRVFADLMASGDRTAPTLLVRITSLSLASYAGNDLAIGQGQSNNDYLEGAGLVVENGKIASTTPILSALSAGYSGAWNLPDIDARRIASITHHFAYWLRREMGL